MQLLLISSVLIMHSIVFGCLYRKMSLGKIHLDEIKCIKNKSFLTGLRVNLSTAEDLILTSLSRINKVFSFDDNNIH